MYDNIRPIQFESDNFDDVRKISERVYCGKFSGRKARDEIYLETIERSTTRGL